ncbi:MAG: glycosyltransferase, partial [Kiritimatiellaeota bacterium]|nr:glycosyltransferase [Kiritimatiellota bacterium]
MTPKVSICIPAYQQPQGLARALQSLLEQDFRDYEVIVTDDSADAA